MSTNANWTFIVNGDRTLAANFARKSYTITATANPSNGGTTTGGGTYEHGQSCTVIATAANGYEFSNWTENGEVVSTNASYRFTVTQSRTLVANFTVQAPNTYTINASPNPSNGGTTTGGGTYEQGQTCTLTATANTGYTFHRWTENGGQVSPNASYSFTVNANRTLVAQFQVNSYTIGASANPSAGGSVTGGGTYNHGQSCTLTATANAGYSFDHWTKNGMNISGGVSITFNVTENATYVAYFTVISYTVSTSVTPTGAGSVDGGGTFVYGQNCTLAATANTGYTFDYWTRNGTNISGGSSLTFTVTSNATYVAHFNLLQAPVGAINGLFTINSNGDQVWFSQGNLQYQASTNTWRFAENQWDYVGTQTPDNLGYFGGTVPDSDNSGISQSYNGWIDLFGWGTSGREHGAECYQPWSSSHSANDYYAYGNSIYNLFDQTGQADWGYNAISNGGHSINTWRTLTGGENGEWDYIIDLRSTPSGIRYALAVVNGVNGVILLPDNWSTNYYTLNDPNGGSSYESNTITIDDWTNYLEDNGAVFLPAAGYRGTNSSWEIVVSLVGYEGWYASSSVNNYPYQSAFVMSMEFGNWYVNPVVGVTNRSSGCSVRLVCPVGN